VDDRGSRGTSVRRGGVEEALELGERLRTTADALNRGVLSLLISITGFASRS
jgi:hypothetical protein